MKHQMEIRIWKGSPLIDKSIEQVEKEYGVEIIKVTRGDNATKPNLEFRLVESDYIRYRGECLNCLEVLRKTINPNTQKGNEKACVKVKGERQNVRADGKPLTVATQSSSEALHKPHIPKNVLQFEPPEWSQPKICFTAEEIERLTTNGLLPKNKQFIEVDKVKKIIKIYTNCHGNLLVEDYVTVKDLLRELGLTKGDDGK